MDGFGVGQLAEAAGVAPSTVRFYERVGLISPANRAPNGYRLFDEAALAELALVSRAKAIGMSLEDIAELVSIWPNAECRSLQRRLRSFLEERTLRVGTQIAELRVFERQLRSVMRRLAARDPGPERCGNGCGCEADLDLGDRPTHFDSCDRACSLSADGLATRLGQWGALAGEATDVQRTADTVRLVFPPGADMIVSIAALCAAETECCPHTGFDMEITSESTVLVAEVTAAPGLLDALLAGAGATRP